MRQIAGVRGQSRSDIIESSLNLYLRQGAGSYSVSEGGTNALLCSGGGGGGGGGGTIALCDVTKGCVPELCYLALF